MAAQGRIADDLLANLAEDIETGEQMEALGRALGFKTATINRYTDTNNKGDRVTCKGTRGMLFDWRQTVKPNDQQSKLKQALEEANLIMLSQNYLKDQPLCHGIDSTKISESLSVLRCREKLKKNYLTKLCKIQMTPWNRNDYAEFKDMHTRVTIVKKDKRGRNTATKEILHGSVTNIFSWKVNDNLPDRILISASAGRGKTTAVAKMAYDWSHRVQGSALEDLPLLFVLPLRNTGKHKSLGEEIKSQLLSDVDDLTPEVLENFIRNNQDICHIIFDGLDEYAGIASGSNIVKVMKLEEYPDCRVLVTTRPHLDIFFNEGELPRVYTKMEIEGFSRESSRDYIDKFFAMCPDMPIPKREIPKEEIPKGESLKVYLDGKPLINELVITPLFCLMVCHLWSEGSLKMHISTQTELLDSVNMFLMHHANARSISGVAFTTDYLRTLICNLGQVALSGLLSDAKKLVFSPRDFRNVAILEKACELGIISKTTVSSTCLPRSHETTSTTIEFYHKLAQEHCAGTHLAAKTMSNKLDGVLRKIRSHMGDYEHLLRYTVGKNNNSCFKILEAILTNHSLDESERYRILLDCSSEIKLGPKGHVSSLVQRCVSSKTIVLKSPTVYTVVGMQNLPKQLKRQVEVVKFEGSTITADVTHGLWSCLGSFPMLRTIFISDSSLSFPPSPPELPNVTKLEAKRVTTQNYEGLFSTIPGLKEIDITIDDAERDISHITTGLQRTGGEQLTRIRLQSLPSQGPKNRLGDLIYSRDVDENCSLEIKKCRLSAEMTNSLWSCFGSFTTLHHLTILDSSLSFPSSPPELPYVTDLKAKRVMSQSYEGLLSSLPGLEKIDITIDDAERDISQITTGLRRTVGEQLTYAIFQALPSQGKRSGRGNLKYCKNNQSHYLEIQECQLSADMTSRLWSCLGSFTTLHHLSISDSFLSFHPSPPELPYVTMLKAKSVTSNSYDGLLSSIPGLEEIDITIDDAKKDISQITTGLQQTGSKHLTRITLQALPSQEKGSGHGSLKYYKYANQSTLLEIKDCILSTEMTDALWSYFRSFPTMYCLTISDSSLSFTPSPHELPYVTKLEARRVTSQSYEGLFLSIPGMKEIDITIADAERDIVQITAGLQRTGGEQLTSIRLEAPPSLPLEKKKVSRNTMKGLGLLMTEQTKDLQLVAVSGVECRDVEDPVALFIKSSIHSNTLTRLHLGSGCGSLNYVRSDSKSTLLEIKDCLLYAEMTHKLWCCLRSFTTLHHLIISDSSLSFALSPLELPSVTKLEAKRLTSQSYEGLISSIPSLEVIDITVGDAERDISQITSGLQRTGREQLTCIRLQALPSIEKMTRCGSLEYYRSTEQDSKLETCEIKDCVLSTEMTDRLWSCFRSFTTLHRLIISDSSLSFPSSPPVLRYVTKLEAQRLTSQSYEGLLSSIPCLEVIDINVGDAERDISQITAGLHRTEREQLTCIRLEAPPSLPLEKKKVSRETMRGLGLLIREQTNNLLWLALFRVECKDIDLVDLVECCRHVKTMSYVLLYCCGTKEGGRLDSHLTDIHPSCECGVLVCHDGNKLEIKKCQLSADITDRLWSCFASFTTLHHLIISDSSLTFPPSPPELPYVIKLKAEKLTSQSYEGLLSSIPGLQEIDITIADAERDISQITASLQQTGGREQLTRITLHAPPSLPSEKKGVSRETMRGLGLLIREQTKNLEKLVVKWVECTDEEVWIDLVECCRHVKSMECIEFYHCGTKEGDSLDLQLKARQTSRGGLGVTVWHNKGYQGLYEQYTLSHAV